MRDGRQHDEFIERNRVNQRERNEEITLTPNCWTLCIKGMSTLLKLCAGNIVTFYGRGYFFPPLCVFFFLASVHGQSDFNSAPSVKIRSATHYTMAGPWLSFIINELKHLEI